jgi:hypothetical protein
MRAVPEILDSFRTWLRRRSMRTPSSSPVGLSRAPHARSSKPCSAHRGPLGTTGPEDFRADDVVLRASELLVFAPSEAAERRYLIALPLDPRKDWYAIGASLAEVLDRYLASEGEKFWEL